MQELRDYGTTTAQLLAMVAWSRHWHVQRVVMESTSTYGKGVYYPLEAEGHATILKMMLDNSDRIGAQIAALDTLIEDAISPFSRQTTRLADIVGVNTVAAAELIAETGADMTRFPSAAHLVSWAKFCPQTHRSAGRSMSKVAARATHGWRARLGASRSPTPAPTPSWAPAIGASRDAAGKQKANRQLGTHPSSTTYSRTHTPNAATSGPDTTNPGSTNTAAPATSPPSSRHSPASTSPSAT
ncbi:transposase, partial [Rhodococcus jostii]